MFAVHQDVDLLVSPVHRTVTPKFAPAVVEAIKAMLRSFAMTLFVTGRTLSRASSSVSFAFSTASPGWRE